MEEKELIEVEQPYQELNTLQIESGSGGYHISALVQALLPEKDFETIVTRITYVERRLRAVKDMPPLHGSDDDGHTEINTEG